MSIMVMWDVGIGGLSVPGEVYMGLLWIYLALTAFSLLLYILSYLSIARPLKKIRFECLSILTGCTLTYLVSLSIVLASPYWVDNEVEKALVFPEHFSMALWGVPFLQLVLVPVVFSVMLIPRYVRRYKNRK